MKVTVRRVEGFAHGVEMEGDHEMVIDEPADRGGTDTGPRPTQLLASSLAGCTAITMEMYAKTKGWEIGRIGVEVEVGFEGPVPSTFDVSVDLPGGLSDERRRKLMVIAGKCPVHRALSRGAEVTVRERGAA